MAETKTAEVILLDDQRLPFNIQAKMYTCDLFDIVSSHLNLREKEYFGLYYLDDGNHQQWLQTDRKVLDHDLPRKSEPILLYFAVRFYIENMCCLQDSVSVELYYLQSRQSIYKSVIECDSTTVFELAAYALQLSFENLTEDSQAREALKKLPVFPTSTLKDHPSINYCEDQVLKRYYAMNGLTRGQAIISYMCIVEKLPTYGIHYYEVKNKQGVPWWLGLSFKGIAQFDYNDKRTPRRVFPWKYLENLYFRDKKFSIEVHDPKRIVHTLSSFNLYEDVIREPANECDDLSDAVSDPTTQVSVSRRSFGPSNVNVHAWFTTKPQLTKSIWSMAVCQHQFFLDRLQNKATLLVKRCPNQIADELTMSTTSLKPHYSNPPGSLLQESALNSLNMDYSKKLKASPDSKSTELTPEQKALQLELYKGLGERKRNMEKVLEEKIKELKELCLKEGEISGELPHEYTMFMSPGEKTPTIKKRIGTTFSIADLVSGKDSDFLSKLEMEYEVQKQITKAKLKLSGDETIPKNVRKKHKEDHIKAYNKLKELEQKLKSARSQVGLDTGSFTSEDSLSLGSSPSLNKSPKKSMSSQQLESLDHSPQTRRRLNSLSKLGGSQKSTDLTSNPSSVTSLASMSSRLEGYHEFTPTKALKYNRPISQNKSQPKLTTQTTTELDSAGSSTANSSTSSLHAYSVSNGRPLRSGSMDDVRMAANTINSGTGTLPHSSQHPDRIISGSNQRAKSYISNNPYGSLERKALKQKRSGSRNNTEGQTPDANANLPPAYNHSQVNSLAAKHMYGNHQRVRRHPPDYNNTQQPPELPAKTQPPSYRHRNNMDREYAQHVQKASRRMYDSNSSGISQPFQMLDNPYLNQRRPNVDQQLSVSMSGMHIAPIKVETQQQYPPRLTHRGSAEFYTTDSSSGQSSPKENAFNFFNTLSQYVEKDRLNVPIPHPSQISTTGSAGESLRPPRAVVNEESKPYEMKDFYQYSEKLRRARGIPGASPRPPEYPPTPTPRSSGSRTPSSPGRSQEGSRSASPFTYAPPGPINGPANRQSPALSHAISSMHHSYSASSLNPHPTPPRRSLTPNNVSFNTGDVADNFSQELLAWYQDQGSDHTTSTLV